MNIRAYRSHRHNYNKYTVSSEFSTTQYWLKSNSTIGYCPAGHYKCQMDAGYTVYATLHRCAASSASDYLSYSAVNPKIRERALFSHTHTYKKISFDAGSLGNSIFKITSCPAGHSVCRTLSNSYNPYTSCSYSNPDGSVSSELNIQNIRSRNIPDHTHDLPDSVISFSNATLATLWDNCPSGHSGCRGGYTVTYAYSRSSQTSGGVEY